MSLARRRLVSSASKTFACIECGHAPFKREAEVRRHVYEQHRCPHEDCESITFLKPQDKDDHHRDVHQNRLGHRCGKCLLEGQPVNTLPRLNKLKEHYRKVHQLKPPFELFKCGNKACVPSKQYGGVFFDSQEALERHQQDVHRVATDCFVSGKCSTHILTLASIQQIVPTVK